MPGLVVDRYGDWLAVQFLTLGVEVRREMLLGLLAELTAPRGIVERSDASVRRQEGLALRSGLAWGEAPPPDLAIREHGLRFEVDLLGGQKTGFYVDQRENRRIVGAYAQGRRVLNAFSFTGAFGVYALAGGAQHVTNLDSSYDALVGAEATLRLNGFDPDRQAESICGDVFQVLRTFRDEGRQFDLVILDPPKFARSKAELDGALRGYKDINLLGLRLLAPGGLLATFSCSGLVTPDLFPEGRLRRQRGCRPRRADPRQAQPGAGPPDPAQLPRGGVSEGAVVPGGVANQRMSESANERISESANGESRISEWRISEWRISEWRISEWRISEWRISESANGESANGEFVSGRTNQPTNQLTNQPRMSIIYERKAEYWARDLADRAFEAGGEGRARRAGLAVRGSHGRSRAP